MSKFAFRDLGVDKLDTHFKYLQTSKLEQVGRYINISTHKKFDYLLQESVFEEVTIPLYDGFKIYKTDGLGEGYVSNISSNRLLELVQAGLVPEKIPIKLKYKYGNLFTIIEAVDIDLELLKTNETYVMVHSDTNIITGIQLGEYTNCNLLYGRKDLDGRVITPITISTRPVVRTIHVEDNRFSDVIRM